MVDTIIVMEAGRIREMGSYEELLNHRGTFSFFLQSTLLHGLDDKSDEDEDEESKKSCLWKKYVKDFTIFLFKFKLLRIKLV